jgi:archaellum component FlaC
VDEVLKQILDRLTNIDNRLIKLEENQIKIIEKIDNLEAINANRHIEISSELKELSQDINC